MATRVGWRPSGRNAAIANGRKPVHRNAYVANQGSVGVSVITWQEPAGLTLLLEDFLTSLELPQGAEPNPEAEWGNR